MSGFNVFPEEVETFLLTNEAVDFRDELPMNGAGKVLQSLLVEKEQN